MSHDAKNQGSSSCQPQTGAVRVRGSPLFTVALQIENLSAATLDVPSELQQAGNIKFTGPPGECNERYAGQSAATVLSNRCPWHGAPQRSEEHCMHRCMGV